MDWKPYITSDPQIMHGAVCFRDTRIPVSVVLDNLASGETPARILAQYPSLKPEHIPGPGQGVRSCFSHPRRLRCGERRGRARQGRT
jgi:uncharacterized protein (DUF433 family)